MAIKVAEAFVAYGGGDEASMISAAQARVVNPIVAPAPSGTGRGVLDAYA